MLKYPFDLNKTGDNMKKDTIVTIRFVGVELGDFPRSHLDQIRKENDLLDSDIEIDIGHEESVY